MNRPGITVDVADYPSLIEGLRERGHSDATIRSIPGLDLLRVRREVEAREQR